METDRNKEANPDDEQYFTFHEQFNPIDTESGREEKELQPAGISANDQAFSGLYYTDRLSEECSKPASKRPHLHIPWDQRLNMLADTRDLKPLFEDKEIRKTDDQTLCNELELQFGGSPESSALNIPADVKTGETYLHKASKFGKFETMKWLLENGADPSLMDKKGRTPIDNMYVGDAEGKTKGLSAKFAIRLAKQAEEEQKEVDKFFRNIAQPDNQDSAIELLSVCKFRLDLDKIVPGHKSKWTYIHAACTHKNLDLVEALLTKKANPNGQTAKGNTPMHLAIPFLSDTSGRRIIEVLMDNGADLNVTSYLRGQTPLDLVRGVEDRKWLENLERSVKNKKTDIIKQPSTKSTPVSDSRKIDVFEQMMKANREANRELEANSTGKSESLLNQILGGVYDEDELKRSAKKKKTDDFEWVWKEDTNGRKKRIRRPKKEVKLFKKVEERDDGELDYMGLESREKGRSRYDLNGPSIASEGGPSLLDQLLGDMGVETNVKNSRKPSNEAFQSDTQTHKKISSLLDNLLNDSVGGAFQSARQQADSSLETKLHRAGRKKSSTLLDQLLNDSMDGTLQSSRLQSNIKLEEKLKRKGHKKKQSSSLLDKLLANSVDGALESSRAQSNAALEAKLKRSKGPKKAIHSNSSSSSSILDSLLPQNGFTGAQGTDFTAKLTARKKKKPSLLDTMMGDTAYTGGQQTDFSAKLRQGKPKKKSLLDQYLEAEGVKTTQEKDKQTADAKLQAKLQGSKKKKRAGSLLDQLLNDRTGSDLAGLRSQADGKLMAKLKGGRKKKSSSVLDELLTGNQQFNGQKSDFEEKLKRGRQREHTGSGLLDQLLQNGPGGPIEGLQSSADAALQEKLRTGRRKKSSNYLDQLLNEGPGFRGQGSDFESKLKRGRGRSTETSQIHTSGREDVKQNLSRDPQVVPKAAEKESILDELLGGLEAGGMKGFDDSVLKAKLTKGKGKISGGIIDALLTNPSFKGQATTFLQKLKQGKRPTEIEVQELAKTEAGSDLIGELLGEGMIGQFKEQKASANSALAAKLIAGREKSSTGIVDKLLKNNSYRAHETDFLHKLKQGKKPTAHEVEKLLETKEGTNILDNLLGEGFGSQMQHRDASADTSLAAKLLAGKDKKSNTIIDNLLVNPIFRGQHSEFLHKLKSEKAAPTKEDVEELLETETGTSILDNLLGDGMGTRLREERTVSDSTTAAKLLQCKANKSQKIINVLLTKSEFKGQASKQLLKKLQQGKKITSQDVDEVLQTENGSSLLDQLLGEGVGTRLSDYRSSADAALMAKLLAGKKKKSMGLIDRLLRNPTYRGQGFDFLEKLKNGKTPKAKEIEELLESKEGTNVLDKLLGDSMASELKEMRASTKAKLLAKILAGKEKKSMGVIDHLLNNPAYRGHTSDFLRKLRQGKKPTAEEVESVLKTKEGDNLFKQLLGKEYPDEESIVKQPSAETDLLANMLDTKIKDSKTAIDELLSNPSQTPQNAEILQKLKKGNENVTKEDVEKLLETKEGAAILDRLLGEGIGSYMRGHRRRSDEALIAKLLRGKTKKSSSLIDDLLRNPSFHGQDSSFLDKLKSGKTKTPPPSAEQVEKLLETIDGQNILEKLMEDGFSFKDFQDKTNASFISRLISGKKKVSQSLIDQISENPVFNNGQASYFLDKLKNGNPIIAKDVLQLLKPKIREDGKTEYGGEVTEDGTSLDGIELLDQLLGKGWGGSLKDMQSAANATILAKLLAGKGKLSSSLVDEIIGKMEFKGQASDFLHKLKEKQARGETATEEEIDTLLNLKMNDNIDALTTTEAILETEQGRSLLDTLLGKNGFSLNGVRDAANAALLAKLMKGKTKSSGGLIDALMSHPAFRGQNTDFLDKLREGRKKRDKDTSAALDKLLGDGVGSLEVFKHGANAKLLSKLLSGKDKKSRELVDHVLSKDPAFKGKYTSFVRSLKQGKLEDASSILNSMLAEGWGGSLKGFRNAAQAALLAKLLEGKDKHSKGLIDNLLTNPTFRGHHPDFWEKLAKGKARQDADSDEDDYDEDGYDENDPINALVHEIFELTDQDKDGALNQKEVGQLMMVIGYKLNVSTDELIEEADMSGSGDLSTDELVDWFRKRGTTYEEAQELLDLIKKGVKGAMNRYKQAASLLKAFMSGKVKPNKLSAQERDAAQLLRYKLKNSNNVVTQKLLSKIDFPERKRLLKSNDSQADKDLVGTLADKSKEQKQDFSYMIDGALDTEGIAKMLAGRQAAQLADLADKLARGKTKQSKSLLDRLFEDGVINKGSENDPNLNLTFLILDIFNLLDTDGARALELPELEHLMLIIGDKLGVTASQLLEQAASDPDHGVVPRELVRWFKKRKTTAKTLEELRALIQAGLPGAIQRHNNSKDTLELILNGDEKIVGNNISDDQTAAADLLRYKLINNNSKPAKELLMSLVGPAGIEKAIHLPPAEANKMLLQGLTSPSANKKQIKALLDSLYGEDGMVVLLKKQRGKTDADILAKLAKGKAKKSKNLLDNLLKDGVHHLPGNEDLGLLITMLVVQLFNLLDTFERGKLEREELEDFVDICGELLKTDVNTILKEADLNKDGGISPKELVKWFKKRGTSKEELRELQRLVMQGAKKVERNRERNQIKEVADGVQDIVHDNHFLIQYLRMLGVDPETLRVLANYLVESKEILEAIVALLRELLGEYNLIQQKDIAPEDQPSLTSSLELRASKCLGVIYDKGFSVLKTVLNHPNLDDAARAILKAKIMQADIREKACQDLIRYIAGDRQVVESAARHKGVGEKIGKVLSALRAQNLEKQRACCQLISHKLIDQKILLKIIYNPSLKSHYITNYQSRAKKREDTVKALTAIVDENITKLISVLDSSFVGVHATLLKIKASEDSARWHAIREIEKVNKKHISQMKASKDEEEVKWKVQSMQKTVYASASLFTHIIQDDVAMMRTWQRLKDANMGSEETKELLKKLAFLPTKKLAVERFLQAISGQNLSRATLGDPKELISILKARIATVQDPTATDLLRNLVGNEDLLKNVLSNAKHNADDWLKGKLSQGKAKRSANLLQGIMGDDWLDGHLDKNKIDAEEALRLKLLRKNQKEVDDDVTLNPNIALELAIKDFNKKKDQLNSKKNVKKNRMLDELDTTTETILDMEEDDPIWNMEADELKEELVADLDVMFDILDDQMSGIIGPCQIKRYMSETLGKDMDLRLVRDVIKKSTPKPGKLVTKEYFLAVIQNCVVASSRSKNVTWDFSCLDVTDNGCLDRNGTTSMWLANRIERSQPTLKNAMRKMGIRSLNAVKPAWPELYTSFVTAKPRPKRFYIEEDAEYEPELGW